VAVKVLLVGNFEKSTVVVEAVVRVVAVVGKKVVGVVAVVGKKVVGDNYIAVIDMVVGRIADRVADRMIDYKNYSLVYFFSCTSYPWLK